MQKEGGTGKNIPSCGTEKEEQLGGSASPLQSDRPMDWQVSLLSFIFSIETNSLAVLE